MGDSDEEFDVEVAVLQKKPRKKEKKSKKSDQEANDPMFNGLYREAESDDEFAKEFLMFPDEPEEKKTKKVAFKKKRKNVSSSNGGDQREELECMNDDPHDGNFNRVVDEDSEDDNEEDEDGNDDEKIDYRIQYILDSRSMPSLEWKDILMKMDTREVTRGSVLQQPDEEFYDPSPEPIEKFLIKWQHASFLHLSWETEKDLLDICGKTVSNAIKKHRYRVLTKTDLFEDLRAGESFPPQYLHVDRILDIEDDTVDVQTVDWVKARLPSFGIDTASAPPADEVAEEEGEMDAEQSPANETSSDAVANMADTPVKDASASDDEPKRSKRKGATSGDEKAETKKKSRKPKVADLHGANCWVVVKWEGLAYSDFTLESAYDLAKAGVDYESALREFYRREQQAPRVGVRGKCVRSLFNMATVLESPAPPTFPVGQLRDYQWEGVRWLLFNWSQKRNSILADEMVS